MTNPKYNPQRGAWQFHITSEYLSGENLLEVLLPDDFTTDKRYRVVYVLPVEAGEERRFGDALQVLRAMDAHTRHGVILVFPTFDTLPWYGHHATDPRIRHDACLLNVVMLLIERAYPVLPAPAGRLLLGFSKSGWGALSLLARFPEAIGAAASWDAPLLMDITCLGYYGTGPHFGAPGHFARFLPPVCFAANPAPFRGKPRLVLAGFSNFGPEGSPTGACHTAGMHAHLEELGIKQAYSNTLIAPHTWNADWMGPLLEMLLRLP